MAAPKITTRIHLGDKGKAVTAFQKAVNVRKRGNPKRGLTILEVDGDAGRQTIAVGRKAATSLGWKPGPAGLGPRAQQIVRYPWLRTPMELRREKKWLKTREKERVEAAAVAAHRPKVTDNNVTGGTPRARVVAAAMAAAAGYYSGRRVPVFYSQTGKWSVTHAITGEPHGYRSDCSLEVTAFCHSAQVPDPNGLAYKSGYTGSLAGHLKEITRAQLKPGDLVIYFLGSNSHHVEMWVGNGDGKTTYTQLAHAGSTYRDRTVGHGSPPVDYGDIDMIAGARFFALDLS